MMKMNGWLTITTRPGYPSSQWTLTVNRWHPGYWWYVVKMYAGMIFRAT